MKARAPVWIDRWELTVGDSLIQRIQDAVAGASALLVILSKASIASEWCRKELTAGLSRELEEKRVVVFPVLLEDCEIPLCLRDKFYADFRSDFDTGLMSVQKAIDKFTNDTRSRIEMIDGYTDWGMDWGFIDNLLRITLTFGEHSQSRRDTVITTINILADAVATARYWCDIIPTIGDRMNTTIHATLAGWGNFYLISGTAAAALTGLQFVVSQ